MKPILFNAFLLILLNSCSCTKDIDDEPFAFGSTKEIKSYHDVLLGHRYMISSIVDQNGNDVRSTFPSCMQDDEFLFDTKGNLTLLQGSEFCVETNEEPELPFRNWGFTTSEDQSSVTGMIFQTFFTGDATYNSRTFNKPNFNIDLKTGEIKLIYQVDINIYTISYKQIG